MNIRKLVKLRDSKVFSASGAVGGEQKETFCGLFSKTSLNRVNDTEKLEEETKKRRVADAKVIQLEEQVKRLSRKVKDAEAAAEKASADTDYYKDLAATFKSDKDKALIKLMNMSEQVEQARQVELPLSVEYDSGKNLLRVGAEEKEAAFEDFIKFIQGLSVVFPDVKVTLKVEAVEKTAKELVSADLVSEFQPNLVGNSEKGGIEDEDPEERSKFGDSKNEVKAAVAALDKFSQTNHVEDLSGIDLAKLPRGLSRLVEQLQRVGYLTEETQEELIRQAGEDLHSVGEDDKVLRSFEDSIQTSRKAVRKKLKKLGLSDSLIAGIPGTPSKWRISDSENRTGFGEDVQILKVGGKYVLYE